MSRPASCEGQKPNGEQRDRRRRHAEHARRMARLAPHGLDPYGGVPTNVKVKTSVIVVKLGLIASRT